MNEHLNIILFIIQIIAFVSGGAFGLIKITRKLTFMESDIRHIKENCPNCKVK